MIRTLSILIATEFTVAFLFLYYDWKYLFLYSVLVLLITIKITRDYGEKSK